MSKSILVEIRQPAEGRARECSACGALGSAGCDCGAPLIVPALERARVAVLANPERSNRVIAAEISVGEATVRRVRESGASSDAPEIKRVGKDGKNYPATCKPLRKRKLRRATIKNSVDPLFLKISEAAALMDTRSPQSIIAETQAQFDKGTGLDHTYVERLIFIRDWLNIVIRGSEKFVVTCSTTHQETDI